MGHAEDEALMLAVLNTTPVGPDGRQDLLKGAEGLAWMAANSAAGSPGERDALLEARDLLQNAARGEPDAEALARILQGVAAVPVLEQGGLTWDRVLPVGREIAARAVLAWAELKRDRPDRVRTCANPDCERYLIDHSRANQAKWCSMAVCGNRAKARRHYERARAREAG